MDHFFCTDNRLNFPPYKTRALGSSLADKSLCPDTVHLAGKFITSQLSRRFATISLLFPQALTTACTTCTGGSSRSLRSWDSRRPRASAVSSSPGPPSWARAVGLPTGSETTKAREAEQQLHAYIFLPPALGSFAALQRLVCPVLGRRM